MWILLDYVRCRQEVDGITFLLHLFTVVFLRFELQVLLFLHTVIMIVSPRLRLHSDLTPCPEKRCHFIFDYTFAFLDRFLSFFSPLETGMNTPQFHVMYLLNSMMTS